MRPIRDQAALVRRPVPTTKSVDDSIQSYSSLGACGSGDQAIHWAERGDRAVICCRGSTQVVVIRRRKCASVYVHKVGLVRHVGNCRTWAEAQEVAVLWAERIGLDRYSYHQGSWRYRPPTERQCRAMVDLDIESRPGMTRGEVADEIDLAIADRIDPDQVPEKRPANR